MSKKLIRCLLTLSVALTGKELQKSFSVANRQSLCPNTFPFVIGDNA